MLSTSSLEHQDRNTDPEDQEQFANRKQTAQEDGEVAELRIYTELQQYLSSKTYPFGCLVRMLGMKEGKVES